MSGEWSLVLHAGAVQRRPGQISIELEQMQRDGLAKALACGAEILSGGGSALDAVEKVVRILEDDPEFNAGRGSVFSAAGRNEMDAAIMDGASLAAGCVAGVLNVRNPITLARAIMENSDHVLMVGAGAEDFAVEQGVEIVETDYFYTRHRWKQLEAMRADPFSSFDGDLKFGTVGSAACDVGGHVAAATSTGGLTGKKWGRVGDSPLIGSGTYADDRACAISTTGSGEHFIRHAAAHEICARVRIGGESVAAAAEAVVHQAIGGSGGLGGVIYASPVGKVGWSFNTSGMYRGLISHRSKPLIALYEK